jgi:hypothetical protein
MAVGAEVGLELVVMVGFVVEGFTVAAVVEVRLPSTLTRNLLAFVN